MLIPYLNKTDQRKKWHIQNYMVFSTSLATIDIFPKIRAKNIDIFKENHHLSTIQKPLWHCTVYILVYRGALQLAYYLVYKIPIKTWEV